MNTRKQYLNNECTHSEYYSQFVTPRIREILLSRIKLEEILACSESHFNRIPLSVWDSLPALQETSDLMRLAGDYLTLAGKVCLYKQAAKQIRDEAREASGIKPQRYLVKYNFKRAGQNTVSDALSLSIWTKDNIGIEVEARDLLEAKDIFGTKYKFNTFYAEFSLWDEKAVNSTLSKNTRKRHMKFKIEIDLENEAFAENPNETARILRDIVRFIELNDALLNKTLRDVNGNTVGKVWVE